MRRLARERETQGARRRGGGVRAAETAKRSERSNRRRHRRRRARARRARAMTSTCPSPEATTRGRPTPTKSLVSSDKKDKKDKKAGKTLLLLLRRAPVRAPTPARCCIREDARARRRRVGRGGVPGGVPGGVRTRRRRGGPRPGGLRAARAGPGAARRGDFARAAERAACLARARSRGRRRRRQAARAYDATPRRGGRGRDLLQFPRLRARSGAGASCGASASGRPRRGWRMSGAETKKETMVPETGFSAVPPRTRSTRTSSSFSSPRRGDGARWGRCRARAAERRMPRCRMRSSSSWRQCAGTRLWSARRACAWRRGRRAGRAHARGDGARRGARRAAYGVEERRASSSTCRNAETRRYGRYRRTGNRPPVYTTTPDATTVRFASILQCIK